LRVAITPGDERAFKITDPQDFARAQMMQVSTSSIPRTASGFDVHAFGPGDHVWLAGVRIPHSHGLIGHSDADAGLHALTDALLGTIAAGDIGDHFPPSDPQWKGAASDRFLAHAASLVRARGGTIDFVDLTLICERPKIGPHRAAMQARVAAILKIDPGQVSIKATTTELLGFTGRSEGIAAQAMASVRLPA
ncbi:2-C-methyl-D-erythritol 2,4-cyclodiphosphate synthase, partial [Polymorphobacter multimanifer]